jgi:simple sugar transport system permease protein
MAVLSLVFAIISIILFLILLALFGFTFNLGDLIEFAFFDVFREKGGAIDLKNLALIVFWGIPLVLTGLSMGIAFHAGLFNIGAQGQLIIGGSLAGIWAAFIVPKTSELSFLDTPFLMLPVTLVVGMIGGGIWGFIPGYLKAKKGAHEVITTILMNLIAVSLAAYWFSSQSYSPYIDKSSLDAYNQTDKILDSARFSLISKEHLGNFLSWTLIVVILTVIIAQIMVYRTNFGFKLRAVGLNQTSAEAAGINSQRVIIQAMTLSGAVAGLAGALLVQGGPSFRYVIGVESTFGFDGIAVALIGQNSPIGIAIASLFFGFLHQSRNNLGSQTNIPPDLIDALQAWIILFAAAPELARRFYNYLDKKFLSKKATEEGGT